MTKVKYDRELTLEAQQRGFDLHAASMEERMEFVDGSHTLRVLMRRLLDRRTAVLPLLSYWKKPGAVRRLTSCFGSGHQRPWQRRFSALHRP